MPWRSVGDRMTYMAGMRNRALAPLYALGARFDRVLFFNDVLWRADAVLALLAARGEAVCALDLDASGLYDAWVLRDVCGAPVSGAFPYFAGAREQAAVRARAPLEVGACWNGVVSLNAAPFLNASGREPLRFPPARADCFESECAVLPRLLFAATASAGPRAVLVPDATVAYEWKWWVWYNVLLRMRVVEWWVEWVERPIARAWWPILGPATRWPGIHVEGEQECVVTDWPRCRRV